MQIRYQYDGLLRPEKIETKGLNDQYIIHQMEYEYNTVNNITQKRSYRNPAGSKASFNKILPEEIGTVDYEYSVLDRVIGADYSENINTDAAVPQGDETFTYDPVGNRLTDDKTTGNWDYNQNNELQGVDDTQFRYNLNGQMTEKTVEGVKTTYRYNLDGRLSEIRDNNDLIVAQYQYDPFGRRTSKHLYQTGEIIYFFYSDEGLIAEYEESGQLIQSYGYKPNSLFTTNPVFSRRPDFTAQAKGGYVYYINDHLATPQKLITETGYKVWEASADAFGKTVVTNNEFRNPLRFSGQYTDDESNLRYNYFRYYDSTLGRYITSDPIGLNGGLNTYGYVGGNPLYWVDPFGLSSRRGSQPPTNYNQWWINQNVRDLIRQIQQYDPHYRYQTHRASGSGWTQRDVNALRNELGIKQNQSSCTNSYQTGSYTNTHASGRTYSGKGSRKRSQQSGRRQARANNDPHTSTEWTPAGSTREAFKQESYRIDLNGGINSPSNYNRIQSPGRNYRQQDGNF
jgi:RHS repeat-associated protein